MDAETHVMLDLETLGTAPGSVILSIGAVMFGKGQIYDRFETHIMASGGAENGLTMDASTVMWWLKQSKEAQEALLSGQSDAVPLMSALEDFEDWLNQNSLFECRYIWGNGPSFDCALLAAAYRECRMSAPWKYSHERCYRTVKALGNVVVEEPREGIHHSALADAEHQAKHLMRILPEI